MDYSELMHTELIRAIEELRGSKFDMEFVRKAKNVLSQGRQNDEIVFLIWALLNKKLRELPYYLRDEAIENIVNGIIHSEMCIDSITTINDTALIEGNNTFHVSMPRQSVLYDNRLIEITDPKFSGFARGIPAEELTNKIISAINGIVSQIVDKDITESLNRENGIISYSIPQTRIFINKDLEMLMHEFGNGSPATFRVFIQREKEEVLVGEVVMYKNKICIREAEPEVIVLFNEQKENQNQR